MRSNHKITFHAIDEYAKEVVLPPAPAKNFIPSWWREIKPYTSEKLLKSDNNEFFYPHVSVKKCFPLLDAVTSGYILPLWADVEVTNVPAGKYTTWITDRKVFDVWASEVTNGMEIPQGYDPTVFKFLNNFVIETPNGYSCLITHPFGYHDLPFRVITGVADTDKLKTMINPTLWFKEDFTGILKKGTPMAQIIPFKRDNWTHEVTLMPPNRNYFNEQKWIRTIAEGAYGLFMRQMKKYD